MNLERTSNFHIAVLYILLRERSTTIGHDKKYMTTENKKEVFSAFFIFIKQTKNSSNQIRSRTSGLFQSDLIQLKVFEKGCFAGGGGDGGKIKSWSPEEENRAIWGLCNVVWGV